MPFPHELYIGEVFFPPLLLNAALGLAAALLTARLLGGLTRYFYHPALVLISLAVLYTRLFSVVLLPG